MAASAELRRVAFFVPSLRGGGAERSVSNLAAAVSRPGMTVDLVLARSEGPYLQGLPADVRVVDLGSSRVTRSLPKLVRYLRAARPDILMSAMDHANLVALLAGWIARSGTRVFVSVRTTVGISLVRNGSLKSRMVLLLMRLLYRWADGIITISRGVGEDLARVTGIPQERMRVLYNPVVTPGLAARAREAPERPEMLAGDGPLVLSVGRLTRAKDYPTLIRAFSILRAKRQARLLILGEGEERSGLEALVRELGLEKDVSLPGYARNPYAYMSRAAVFVLSSAWEGLSCVLIEALACGCPVVSTDCRSGPAEVLENGRYGPLVPVGDAQALAEAIDQALDAPLPGEELRHRAARFSVDTVAQEFLDIVR